MKSNCYVCEYCKAVYYDKEECQKHEDECKVIDLIMYFLRCYSNLHTIDRNMLIPYLKTLAGNNKAGICLIDKTALKSFMENH